MATDAVDDDADVAMDQDDEGDGDEPDDDGSGEDNGSDGDSGSSSDGGEDDGLSAPSASLSDSIMEAIRSQIMSNAKNMEMVRRTAAAARGRRGGRKHLDDDDTDASAATGTGRTAETKARAPVQRRARKPTIRREQRLLESADKKARRAELKIADAQISVASRTVTCNVTGAFDSDHSAIVRFAQMQSTVATIMRLRHFVHESEYKGTDRIETLRDEKAAGTVTATAASKEGGAKTTVPTWVAALPAPSSSSPPPLKIGGVDEFLATIRAEFKRGGGVGGGGSSNNGSRAGFDIDERELTSDELNTLRTRLTSIWYPTERSNPLNSGPCLVYFCTTPTPGTETLRTIIDKHIPDGVHRCFLVFRTFGNPKVREVIEKLNAECPPLTETMTASERAAAIEKTLEFEAFSENELVLDIFREWRNYIPEVSIIPAARVEVIKDKLDAKTNNAFAGLLNLAMITRIFALKQGQTVRLLYPEVHRGIAPEYRTVGPDVHRAFTEIRSHVEAKGRR